MKLKITIASLLLTLTILSSCNSKNESVQQEQGSPIRVKVNSISADNDAPFISASGKIAASHSANLSTRMMGFVDKIHAKVGDKVNK